jgi:8-oxo-dGTP pyrophosphatase MutT (NUDIX family)
MIRFWAVTPTPPGPGKNPVLREFSAGGLVVRPAGRGWELAVIEPRRDSPKKGKQTLALPKGNVDAGETPEQTAAREVREETGLEAELAGKLGDVKYFYVRSWAGGERVFKVVSFYLFRYRGGVLGEIEDAMRIEVASAEWIPLEEAPRRLSYKGEREMANKALEVLTGVAAAKAQTHRAPKPGKKPAGRRRKR